MARKMNDSGKEKIELRQFYALITAVRNDAKAFSEMSEEWRLGYWSALDRLESILRPRDD